MGENLVENLISHGETLVVWNRTAQKSHELAQKLGNKVIAADTLEEFIKKLGNEKKNVFLLVPAGKVTNEIAEKLFTLLSPGDAIWDLGNAHWDTTIANQAEAQKHGIHWIWCGISGGSEWARLWPSLMPGGDENTIRDMLPVLEKIAAKDFNGKPCVTYVGREAAGNFVKMVHNGIEYAIMQGISEIYDMLRDAQMQQENIQTVFRELNTGYLKSFLLDITVDILWTHDPKASEEFLLEKITGKAGSKGTGGWTVEAALKLGVPVPTIAESLFARWMSGRTEKVTKEHWLVADLEDKNVPTSDMLGSLLTLIYLASYIQGLELILKAESEWNWWINLDEVIRIWQWGCIIRSRMLEVLPDFYHGKIWEKTREFMEKIAPYRIMADEVLDMVYTPTPVASSAIQYIRTFASQLLPTNLIQAMRDSFGAHGVKRIGSEESENFRWK